MKKLMIILRSDWGLTFYLILICIIFTGVIAVAIINSPIEPFVTNNWKDAQTYERNCKGDTLIQYDAATREYFITCKEK